MAKSNIYIDGEQAGRTLKELRLEYAKVKSEIINMKRDSDQYRESVKKMGDLKGAINKHAQDIKSVSDSYKQAKSNIDKLPSSGNSAAISFKSLASQALPFVGIAGLISVGIQGVTSAISSWYRNNKEMEKSLSSLRSITGASEADLKFYAQTAKEIGRTTTLSAIQAVDAFKLIGSARPELLKDRDALASVAKEAVILSEAAGMELAPSAQALASTMNQFGLGADQARRIINTLAAGSVAGAAEIEDLTATIDRSGTIMKSYNVSVEEGVALAELLSEKNLKGAEAGTQLRNVLLQMSTASALDAKAVAAMERYGVNIEKVMNVATPFNERLKEMSKISGDQTALLQVFGKENIIVGQTILQNIDHFAKLKEEVTGTNTAYVQARINNDNLDGDLKKLSSAWEGLTLSTTAAQSPMREIVQTGTEVLNWMSDMISLFTEWDSLKFEEVLLKTAKAFISLLPFSDAFAELIDNTLRYNQLTQDVVNGMKAQADEASTLIQALDLNNKKLKDSNLTEIESNAIKEENANIIAELNTKYPELTANLDLQSASSKTLSKLQKEITENLMDQSIAAVQASEAERLLAEMVQESMRIAELRANRKNEKWITIDQAAVNLFSRAFTDSESDIQEEITKTQEKLQMLPETMKQVKDRVKSLNINFGAVFEQQTKQIESSVTKINNLRVNAELFKGTIIEKILNKQIESENEVLKVTKKMRDDEKKKYIDKLNDIDLTKKSEKELIALQNEYSKKEDEHSQQFLTRIQNEMKAREKSAAKRQEQAQVDIKKYEELKKALDDVINASSKFRLDFDYEKQLAAFTTEKKKEIFILESSIEKKYEKEIASAEKLSKEKGEIGKKASAELSALELVKAEELEFGKKQITDKYAKIAMETRDKSLTDNVDLMLKQYEQDLNFQKTYAEIKLARAYAYAKSIAKNDVEAQKQANEAIKLETENLAKAESAIKANELKKQFDTGTISQQEYDLQREENERVLQEKIKEIQISTQEEVLQAFQQRFEQVLQALTQYVDTANKLFDSYFAIQKNNVINDKNQAIAAEQEKLNQGLISHEEFELKKQDLMAQSDKKQREIEIEKAKADKAFAIFRIAMDTSQAVMKSFAVSPETFGLPFSAFALAAGIAQTAAVMSEPLPQYKDGGFRKIIGANDGKTYNAKQVAPLTGGMTPTTPSYALFSEQGPEYFIPNNLLRDVRVANMVNAIEAIRTNQAGNASISGGASMTDPKLLALLTANLQMMNALSAQIPNMHVKIGDKQIDDISQRSNDLNAFKA